MKFLLCMDGKAPAEEALAVLTPLAKAAGAEVVVLGIAEEAREEKFVDHALARAEQALRTAGVSATSMLRLGEPVHWIEIEAVSTRCDLVAIGAVRGRGGPRAMSGKAYDLIRGLERPVLVVTGSGCDLRRVLLCTSGHPVGEPAVRLAGALGAPAGWEMTLLHVLPEPPAIFGAPVDPQSRAEALLASSSALGRGLRREKEMLEAAGMRVHIRLREGLVVPEVAAEMETGNYDMVVTGVAIRPSHLRTYALGDVTRQLLEAATCAVLIVPGELPESPWRRALTRAAKFLGSRRTAAA